MIVAAGTDIGCRKENQDCFRIGTVGGFSYYIVCDGMGGGDFGAAASLIACDTIERQLKRSLSAKLFRPTFESIMRNAASKANKAVIQQGTRLGGSVHMGTTAVIAVVDGESVHLIHSGDSRAYIIKRDGIVCLTTDHSFVQELIDSGQITAEAAYNHPQKNIVTSVLGIDRNPRMDYSVNSIAMGEYLLLCTDGLTNALKDPEIKKSFKSNSVVQRIPAQLIKKALTAKGTDNITVVVARAE